MDDIDAQEAKHYYGKEEEFNALFSYRKGSQLVPLKKAAQIARRYRKIEGHPRFWDYEEDEGERTQRKNLYYKIVDYYFNVYDIT